MEVSQQQLLACLKEHFGYDEFRLSQQEVISRSLQAQSSVVIMPTGGGKSLCYQLPALLLPGLTVVVSPLIALMQDQVDSLSANGIAAAALNSHCSVEQEQAIYQKAQNGRLRLLYVSPERGVQDRFVQWVQGVHVSQIAIDEAHCVSVWGNDFRPEYRKLTKLLAPFPQVPVVALTATADEATQKDIIEQLGLNDAQLFLSSFERPNITLSVLPAQKRFQVIQKFLSTRNNTAGVIYCLSRKSTEEIAIKLKDLGYRAAFYHARLSAEERSAVATRFQRDEIDIICATIAFGMGIDKPNIRWVIHHNMPKNIESYYQEIGRAGRDGEPSEALLFAGFGDMKVLTDFIDNSQGDAAYQLVQKSKLERMWKFSQTASCRTNVILNYFGEYRDRGCGHCDRCLNPPETFDGTIIAQKALSACFRLNQQVNMMMLVDVLRGSRKSELMEQGYHQIKTYGAGKDIDWQTWLDYITQLIDIGLLSIDFTDGNKLRLTELSQAVLKSQKTVELIEPQALENLNKKSQLMDNDAPYDRVLFERLRVHRLSLADARSIPPFAVFSDATLKDMARQQPLNQAQFLAIKGVGRHKLEAFGESFANIIGEYLGQPVNFKVAPVLQRSSPGESLASHLVVAELAGRGMSVADIARSRDLKKETVVNYLVKAYHEGADVDFSTLVSEEDLAVVMDAWDSVGRVSRLKPIYEELDGAISYDVIRMALILIQQMEQA